MKFCFAGRTAMVTGASSGIGAATALSLARAGCKVWCASRSGGLPDAPPAPGLDALLVSLCMDVTSEASVREGVGRIVASDGNIDILVNCAGMGVSGPAEETGWDMLSLQFDTNVFGSLAVTRAVLPIMRESGAGRVVFTGSVAGRIPIPFQSAYSASKAAISSFARAIRSEVKPFGITVSVVEPGDVKTNFTNQRAKKKLDADSPYSSAADAAVSHMERDELAGMAPEAIADAILNLLSKRRPPARLVPGAQYKLLAFLQRLLPDATVERIVEKIYLGRR